MADRLSSMSRFAEPDEIEPTVVSYCSHCGEDLHEGETAYSYDGQTYCTADCLADDISNIEYL